MGGAALAIGGLAIAGTLAFGAAAVGAAGAVSQRAAGAADSAALAAADITSGAVPVDGDACAVAERVAAAHGATVDECRIDGLIATVRVTTVYAGVPVVASARAGPPGSAEGGG
ncbi:MAG: helicase [Actinobacteria bacterium]|nr:helicase [Actinomycetota bacterium]